MLEGGGYRVSCVGVEVRVSEYFVVELCFGGAERSKEGVQRDRVAR